jgi:hypothetical protein
VHPLLHGDVAGAVQAFALAVHERGLLRLSPFGFSVPSSKPVRSWPWALVVAVAEGVDHVPQVNAGASAFCTLRVTCSRSPRSEPRSQHHSVPGVDGHLHALPEKSGNSCRPGMSAPSAFTSEGADADHDVAAVDQRRQARQRLLDGAASTLVALR